jgi:hypothetical protein
MRPLLGTFGGLWRGFVVEDVRTGHPEATRCGPGTPWWGLLGWATAQVVPLDVTVQSSGVEYDHCTQYCT